jgi:glucosylglycerate synthase
MPEPVTLSEDAAQQVARLGSVDLVVGVASHNNADTIGSVVQAAWLGLERAFPGARVAVVHADGGARDDTAAQARAAMPEGPLVQVSIAADRTPRLGPSPAVRAGAFRLIFTLAARLGARGCAVLDADVTSVTPAWVGRLLGPVQADQADFVTPCFARHPFAGALTTSVAYPFVRALYGRRMRNPIGGEFACSSRLVQRCLAADVWQSDLARLGPDVWLAIQALTGGFRLSQAFLGVKTQVAGDGVDLSGTLARVLGALFLETERTVSVWQKIRGSQPVPVIGADGSQSVEPEPVDQTRALESFRLGARNLQDIWSLVLPPLTLLELQKLARLPDATFRFPDALWVRIVYDFALAYHVRVMNRDHLLSAFTPLYTGWLGSWVGEMQNAAAPEVEARTEQLCLRYEAEKPYFISRWRWPDQFNP